MTTRATILGLMRDFQNIIEPGSCNLPFHLPRGLARPQDAEFLAMAIHMARGWLKEYPLWPEESFGCWCLGAALFLFLVMAGIEGDVNLWVVGLGGVLLTVCVVLETALRLWRKMRVANLVVAMEAAFDNVRRVDAA